MKIQLITLALSLLLPRVIQDTIVNDVKVTDNYIGHNDQTYKNTYNNYIFEGTGHERKIKSYYTKNVVRNYETNKYSTYETRLDVAKITTGDDYEGKVIIYNDINRYFNTSVTLGFEFGMFSNTNTAQYTQFDKNVINTLQPKLESFLNISYSQNNYTNLQNKFLDIEDTLDFNYSNSQLFTKYNYNEFKNHYTDIRALTLDIPYNNGDPNVNEVFYVYQYTYIHTTNVNQDAVSVNYKSLLSQAHTMYSQVQLQQDGQIQVSTIEVIDIAGLMFTILGMPFAWISTAFNLTIFPGTMYELNVASILFSVIAALIVVWIIRRFTA